MIRNMKGLTASKHHMTKDGSPTLTKRKTSQSRDSTPIPVRHPSTRPVTPDPLLSVQSTLPVAQTDNITVNDPVPISPSPHKERDESGSGIARIRAQPIENYLALTQAAELRRPEYFKRTMRMAQGAEPSSSTAAGDVSLPSDVGRKHGSLLWATGNVGVVDSPMKGRRIALFQETSDESFEESLMAGGYGRYRSDRHWRKPQQGVEVSDRPTDTTGEEFGSMLVLSEEEKRKKARLSAFFDPPLASTSKTPLFPVEIEGCGRVLMMVEPSEPPPPHKPSPSKPKRSRKRRKLSADPKQDPDPDCTLAEDLKFDGPNWPDTEFPWRSQDSLSTAEQEERLRYIGNFLDRDSDGDDSEDGRSSTWQSPDGLTSQTHRPGRGKMYPLLSHSKDRQHGLATLAVTPSDPADARTALLSKKSVRAVQQRLLRRQMIDGDANSDEGETVCICQGRDDGRPLVQCDACRTWYHLECIGIQSTSELGREEDPWFCANCVEVKTPPPVILPLSEPIFMDTKDEDAGVGQNGSVGPGGYDPPFLNAGLNPSPMTPWTRTAEPPTTPPRIRKGSSWDEPSSSSSHEGPHTPQFNTASAFGDMVRVYGTTSGRSLEPSSSTTDEFDPTSTPSRGIRFGVPFTTPKDAMWGSSWQGVRGSGPEIFHTPYRPGQDGGCSGQPVRYGQHLLYPAKVEEVSEERMTGPGVQGKSMSGPNDTTTRGPLRMQTLESPLGAKRPRMNS